MSRFKVLMANPAIPRVAFDILSKHCELITTSENTRAAILEAVVGVDAIFWGTKQKLDKEVLDKAGPQIKVVCTMSSGLDHIDVSELKRRGIRLGNATGVLQEAVADVAVLLALSASRRLHEGRLSLEKGQWTSIPNWSLLGRDVAGATVGIVGLGAIGSAVLRRLKGFNVGKFLYTGHRESQQGKDLGANFVPFDTLVKDSDFVVVCAPLTSETRFMFNDDIFAKMKRTAVFVNVSRGELVDQEALIRALKNKTIFAAGLDVMTPEPLPTSSELLKLPNLVLLPHMGSATQNTVNSMAELTAQNILRGLHGEEMTTPIC